MSYTLTLVIDNLEKRLCKRSIIQRIILACVASAVNSDLSIKSLISLYALKESSRNVDAASARSIVCKCLRC